MAMTPSKYRRQGREAFCPGEFPGNHFNSNNYGWNHFLDGWKEASNTYETEEHDRRIREEGELKFSSIRDKISLLMVSDELTEVLGDIMNLIEEIKNDD